MYRYGHVCCFTELNVAYTDSGHTTVTHSLGQLTSTDLVSAKGKTKVSWLISIHSLIRQCFNNILIRLCNPSRVRNINAASLAWVIVRYYFSCGDRCCAFCQRCAEVRRSPVTEVTKCFSYCMLVLRRRKNAHNTLCKCGMHGRK